MNQAIMPDVPKQQPLIDFRDAAFQLDPYPTYERLRQTGPLHKDPYGIWLVTRYEEVNALLRSSKLGRDIKQWSLYQYVRPFVADSVMEGTVEQWMLMVDGAVHTRLRRLVARAFTPPVVAVMRTHIEAIADELIAPLKQQKNFDLMAQFAQPFPVRVICSVLGLPASDFASTKAWSDALSWMLEPAPPRERRDAASRAVEDMLHYLRAKVAQCRKAPGDDLLSLLISHEQGDQLTEDELLGNLMLLFVAGHETTSNLIGNGMHALLRNPDQLQRLRNDQSLMKTAIEEMLRFDGPVNITARITHEKIEVAGKKIPKGELLYCLTGGANRDPEVFADPNHFDIGRTPNPHLTFGGGVHYCIGAPLARLEAEIAFGRLLAAWPDLQIAPDGAAWRSLVNLRGLERLVIAPSMMV
jgi:pimeloyl-[acyl-carrier protein] synthase